MRFDKCKNSAFESFPSHVVENVSFGGGEDFSWLLKTILQARTLLVFLVDRENVVQTNFSNKYSEVHVIKILFFLFFFFKSSKMFQVLPSHLVFGLLSWRGY